MIAVRPFSPAGRKVPLIIPYPALEQFRIDPQPDDFTCGPTCLQAVYRHFGDHVPLAHLVESIPRLPTGGTLSAFLGADALRRGYKATLYTYNLKVFDPTWFELSRGEIRAKLAEQAAFKKDPKLRTATKAYSRFLELGGRVRMQDLRPRLIRDALRRGQPVLTGLSSTYLYQSPREFGPDDDYDDVRGEPQGHFVVLCGYDRETKRVRVADPLEDTPAFTEHLYDVPIERVITAILLGIVTYDANLLILTPPAHPADEGNFEA